MPAPTDVGNAPGAPTATASSSFNDFRTPTLPISEHTVLAEAEEFEVGSPGWQPRSFGTNYYAATFANTFLSRKAYLGAPEQSAKSSASIAVQIPSNGHYLALVRYEAAYRFETQFRLQIEQGGSIKLDRVYGARSNPKIWAFGKKVVPEATWAWGNSENIVWEGHDAGVDLLHGPARLYLIAHGQPEPAARRNIDLVMLTRDVANVERRIQTEKYLPLDGMLTQAGDVYLKVHNRSESSAFSLKVPNGTEHSPYWIHTRAWLPKTIDTVPGQSTDWIEVGSLLDSLNDGQWNFTTTTSSGPLSYDLEFGIPGTHGSIEPIRRFERLTRSVTLAYDADTRRSRRIRLAEEVLDELVSYLEKQPIRGVPLRRTLVFGFTFDPQPENDRYNQTVSKLIQLMGTTAVGPGRAGDDAATGKSPRAYIDVRGIPTAALTDYCKKLKAQGKAEGVGVVSLGDEIRLGVPKDKDHSGFRTWLQSRGIDPKKLDGPRDAQGNVGFQPEPEFAASAPRRFFYSTLYSYQHGISELKARTQILQRFLPNAHIGANFSPHHGSAYLGTTHQWVSSFRADAMTMPWSEDYIFQMPVGSPQVNSLAVDLLRSAIRTRPNRKIQYYVMPHTPGNTVKGWRRQFYGDIAHGVKIFNLFELRPVQAAYTENHVNFPEMYQEIRKALHELGTFEDIVQDGSVRHGLAALWFSEVADVWDDNRSPFDAHKRALYLAIRHRQLPLDVVVEGDPLSGYKLLYVADRHLSQKAARAIGSWVEGGGHLIVTAGGGMFDEFNGPNDAFAKLVGVRQDRIDIDETHVIRLEKQDLPTAPSIGSVDLASAGRMPIFGARSRISVGSAIVTARFDDGSPAITSRRLGKGSVSYLGFLPGLSYLKPALPNRPVDRGTTDDAMNHYLPTVFDQRASDLLEPVHLDRSVVCSTPLVESTLIESRHGTLIPLVNWTGAPIQDLQVRFTGAVPTTKVRLASGGPVSMSDDAGSRVFRVSLDVADALILP